MTDVNQHQYASVAGRVLASHARDIVLLMRLDGELVYANTAAERAYGFAAEELVGKNIRDLRASGTRPIVREQMNQAADEGALFETVHLRSDGSEFPVEVSSRSVEVEGESFLLSVVRDITARREREIRTAELLDDLESANRQLEGLLKIVSSAVGRVEIEQLLQEVLGALREVMDADGTFIFALDENVWRLRSQSGFLETEFSEFVMSADEGFASDVAAAGKILWVQDVGAESSTVPAHETYQVKSMLGMPLYLEGELLGVLECAWCTERLVSEAERVMLQVGADRIIAAVVAAQRFESTLRSQQLELTLSEASVLVGSSHDLDATMPRALAVAADALGCDVVALGQLSHSSFEMAFAAGTDPRRVHIDAGLAGALVPGIETLEVVRGEAPTTATTSLLEILGLEEGLVVPVSLAGGVAGVAVFGRHSERWGCGEAEIAFAKRFSAMVSAAVRNAHDYESEHRIAEALQEALLMIDEDIPGVEVGHLYRSATLATRVGGDFYDVFKMSDGKVGILVGDVSGKGLDAAVLTSFVKDTLRAFVHSDPSPAAVMRRANEVLTAAARLPDFASVVLLVVDTSSGEVAYCSAGHPPAMIRRGGGRIEKPSVGSPVIGALPEMEFTEEYFTLTPDDVVVLYTDGVTEARAQDGAFFGDERLIECIAGSAQGDVARVPHDINQSVMRFTGGRLSDDIAIVAFRLV